MRKDKDFLSDLLKNERQEEFDLQEGSSVESPKKTVFVGLTPEGYGLYKVSSPHGGDVYYTDQYGSPMEVWDTGISNLLTVFSALNDTGEGEVLWKHIGAVFGYK